MQGIRKTIAFNLKLVFLILFFFYSFSSFQLNAQQNLYDSDLLSVSFHKNRRDTLIELLPPKTCAVFFSNPVRNRSNDVNYQYFQDPDFYYLTGLNEPNAALLLFSNPVKIAGKETREVIFVQDRDVLLESWNGKRLGIEGVSSKLGFNMVFLNSEFEGFFPDLGSFENLYAKLPADIRETGKRASLNTMVTSFREKAATKKMGIETSPLYKLMASLREIKQKEELILMQKAVDISVSGFEEVIRAIKPGMTEYQAQAIVEFYFRHYGSEYPGYGSISGGGENSCVLHYVTNRKKVLDGDLLLMDMGAEYHGYTADITRTVPVNGVFSPEQKQIYELVLEAQLQGIEKVRKGNQFFDAHQAATTVIAKGLVRLGILTDSTDVKRYFTHGTSHYLGMEVHDPGSFGPLKPGMIMTVEPGIYIPEGSPCDKKWWNIGVRIEDDVLVTENEPFVLSGKLIKSIPDLEKMMQEESLFDRIK